MIRPNTDISTNCSGPEACGMRREGLLGRLPRGTESWDTPWGSQQVRWAGKPEGWRVGWVIPTSSLRLENDNNYCYMITLCKTPFWSTTQWASLTDAILQVEQPMHRGGQWLAWNCLAKWWCWDWDSGHLIPKTRVDHCDVWPLRTLLRARRGLHRESTIQKMWGREGGRGKARGMRPFNC